MASGKEEDVEAAVKLLLELAGQQRDSVPILLALASGFMLKKQTPKARSHCCQGACQQAAAAASYMHLSSLLSIGLSP